ncbi:MAG TPA: hypothetical protein VJC18_04075, partial [bacterium]|nr:hypothetical protein [bacterium]
MKTQNHKHWPLVIMLAGVTFLVLTLYPRTSLSQTGGLQRKELSAVGEPNNNNATVFELKEKAIERIFQLNEKCGDRIDNNHDNTIDEGCCGNGSLDRPAEECDTTTAVPNAHCNQCEVVCDSGYTKTMVNNRIACVAEAICGDGSKNQPTE